jgi:hypothetical protein
VPFFYVELHEDDVVRSVDAFVASARACAGPMPS